MKETKPYDDSVIFSYTAEQAIEDGVLFEVNPDLRSEAGYRWAVRITSNVMSLVTPSLEEQSEGQSTDGRLWDILSVLRVSIANANSDEGIIPFDVILGKQTVRLWGCVDTTSGPAIHIMTPEEY